MRFHGVTKNFERVCIDCHCMVIHRATSNIICNIRYKTPEENLVVFYNWSNYDYHFVIKQLVEEFDQEKTLENK